MIPLVVLAAGGGLLIAGALVLRSFGPRYRVGRLLAGIPVWSVAEAVEVARSGIERYVAVEGRIDAEDEFPDENHRPLVFRRVRISAQRGGRWDVLDEHRRLIPFEVHEGLDAIAVAGEDLDEGLVVLPRESSGVAREAPDVLSEHAGAVLAPETPVRVVVEQLSTVEHARVLGVARLDRSGRPVLAAGGGRPLIVSTLESVEAMQLLTGGRRGAAIAAAVCLVGGLALLAVGTIWALVGGVG